MAENSELILSRGGIVKFEPSPTTAGTNVVEVRTDGLHILQKLNLYDCNHRRLAREHALANPEEFPLLCKQINLTTDVLVIMANNGQIADDVFTRCEQQLWALNNTQGSQLKMSQQMMNQALTDLFSVDQGNPKFVESFPRLFISCTMDNMNRSGPLKGRIDMTGDKKGSTMPSNPIALTEMSRTLDWAYTTLVRTGDIAPKLCVDRKSFDTQQAIFQMVCETYWQAILDRWKRESDPKKHVLFGKKGLKCLNYVLGAFLRYSRSGNSTRFNSKYGKNMTLEETMKAPLAELLDKSSSRLNAIDENRDFWVHGGGHSLNDDFNITGSKGDIQRAKILWKSMKPVSAQRWTDFTNKDFWRNTASLKKAKAKAKDLKVAAKKSVK